MKRVARLAGVSNSTLGALFYGRKGRRDGAPREKIRAETSTKILGVPMPPLDVLAGGVPVDATGSARRVRALVAAGWPVRAVSARTGMDRQVLDAVVKGDRTQVTAATARQIRDAYEHLWDMPAPEGAGKSRALRRAVEAGWAPPAAWDDEALDDPCAPDPDLTPDAREGADLDEWMRLVRYGEDPARAARRLGVTVAAIDRKAARQGRADITALSSTACSKRRAA